MQSALLEAGSSPTKFSCIGERIKVLDWGLVGSVVDLEGWSALLEDDVEGAAALRGLSAWLFSAIAGLPLTDDACLLGGGDMDLSLEDWNAS